jgi:hypothetical protein
MNRVYHFNDSDKQSVLINSDQLWQYTENELEAKYSTYCDYNIVATLGTPVSGKSKCMLTKLLYKLANRDQPHFSMIYLAPTLLAVMPMAM